MDLFVLKKIIGAMLMPLPLVCLMLSLGLFLLWIGRSGWAKALLTLGVTFLILISTRFMPEPLLREIEQEYSQFDLNQPVSHVVVLGCAHTNDAQMPITSQLDQCSLVRTIEAMRIYLANPGSKIITSGYSGGEPFTNAEMNKRLLLSLQVDEADIIEIRQPRDTEEEAAIASPYLNNTRFALVTSASHIPRAMRLFEAQGLEPIAAPTNHLVRYGETLAWRYHLPHSKQIQKSERLWYETLGQLWLSIKQVFV